MLDRQESLEAVAAALYIAAVPDSAVPWEDAVFQIKDRYRHLARAALAASRQPVSGGSEGEVEKAARWLWDYDTSGNDGAWDETEREEYRDTAKDLLAALSRVPADGPGCTCGNGEAEEDRAAVLRCPVHRPIPTDGVWPDESGVESGSLAGYREAVPADGEQPAGQERVLGRFETPGDRLHDPSPGSSGGEQLTPEMAQALGLRLQLGHAPYEMAADYAAALDVLDRLASGENPDG